MGQMDRLILMEQEIQRRPPHHELQLLPSSACHIPSSHNRPLLLSCLEDIPPATASTSVVDLQLSISLRGKTTTTASSSSSAKLAKIKYTTSHGPAGGGNKMGADRVKWEAAEQIRLAAMEKAYAERVRELARKEMELAHNELARASHVWERAREEVGRAERLKEQATTRTVVDEGTCMEITCHCCRQSIYIRYATRTGGSRGGQGWAAAYPSSRQILIAAQPKLARRPSSACSPTSSAPPATATCRFDFPPASETCFPPQDEVDDEESEDCEESRKFWDAQNHLLEGTLY